MIAAISPMFLLTALVASVIAAHARDTVVGGLTDVAEAFTNALPCRLARAFHRVADGLDASVRRALETLGVHHPARPWLRTWAGWPLIAPLFYAAVIAIVVAAEAPLAVAGFAATLQEPPPDWALATGTLGGVLIIAAALVWGKITWDIIERAPWGPWAEMDGAARRTSVTIAFAGMLTSVIAVAGWFAFRALQADVQAGELASLRRALSLALSATLGLHLVAAVALLGWALLDAVGVIIIIVMFVAGAVARFLGGVCEAAVDLAGALLALGVMAYDLAAAPGRIAWNALAGVPLSARAGIRPLALPKRPRLRDYLDRDVRSAGREQ